MSTDRSLWRRKCDVSRIFNFENLSQLDSKILKIAILFKSYYCIIYLKIHNFLLTLDLLKHDVEYFCVPYIFHSYQYSKTKTSGHKVFFILKLLSTSVETIEMLWTSCWIWYLWGIKQNIFWKQVRIKKSLIYKYLQVLNLYPLLHLTLIQRLVLSKVI